ncbi:CUB-like domain-containing protein [Caenorhabditis elegans]|uniref:CUB-like domain-containing protein n=1 Tax=Caenorhabditis elegans TaxID=6239 RepID=Q9XUH3_CAEEL|nr:CUB-like domain-containing protein [Caenorhabditis elegans]CAB05138.1 CUB-like domain-containing protein [Caenorhabditis elegans]|eukprot:NP_502474.1 Downstream Of DAF-16 (regulated by DAF-16) [Caenorhabditis elegans]
MIRSTVLILASFALAVNCYECMNNTVVINAPSDISKPVFYPDGWDGQSSTPQISENQQCVMTINVPTGYYATVTFYKHFTEPGGYLYFPSRKIELLQNDDYNPYIFPSPMVKINIGTDNRNDVMNQFGFKVVYSKYPTLEKNIINIDLGSPPVAAKPSEKLTTFVGDRNSMMSLMGFTMADNSKNYLLRQTAIFGGDSTDSTYIGSLSQILNSQQILTTYGNKISVYTFGLDKLIDYPLFMGQNQVDTMGLLKYNGANCPSTGNCNVTLNGNWGAHVVVVTSYDGPETIKSFDSFPDTGVLNVYENNVSNTTCIATLNKFNYLQQLPLQVNGNMKFYELRAGGVYNMVVTRDTSRASRHQI